jgi:alpha-L-arabinofuranosidase
MCSDPYMSVLLKNTLCFSIQNNYLSNLKHRVMKKTLLIATAVMVCSIISGQQAQKVNINIKSGTPSGIIDSKIYGQLFEHIYFSADGGLWGEMIAERSFEPEQYPGIPPREGFFDGWYEDADNVLHSPTLMEQPMPLVTTEGDNFVLNTDIKWRGFKLDRHMWSGGYADMRVFFRTASNGINYRFRLRDPQYESASPFSQQQLPKIASFSIEKDTLTERRGRDGKTTTVTVWKPVKSVDVKPGQIDMAEQWHNLRIECKGKTVIVFWDNKQVLKYSDLGSSEPKNNLAFGVNYTAAQYKNIKITSADGKNIYLDGIPEVVKNPPVAPQWKSFGNGKFEMVRGNAVNMDFSQKITSPYEISGVAQGPFSIVKGELYSGSVWAKGDGNTELIIALASGGKNIAAQELGKPGKEWKKYDLSLNAGEYKGDADLAIGAKGGSLQVDQVSMMSASAIKIGGFRPDIYKAVEQLHPTCLRWPGGGYAAQYSWKWGVGPQENRTRWPHIMWMNYDQNSFGTDEFIQLCRQINSEPVIVIRIGFDRPESEHAAILQEACDWVAYCNEPVTGKWGRQRAANGHPEPYNVKYWEIDNEMWEFGIEAYEASVREFSTAMRKVDPTIKIIVCGGFGNTTDKEFLNRSGNYFDYVSLHHYEGENGYASGPARLAKQYEQYADMIAGCPNPNIKLFISEWNLNSIDWRTGLFAGGFLNMCEQHPVVEMGAAALFIRRTDAPAWNNAFINFDYKGLFVAPNYLVTRLWYDNFSKYRLVYTGETGSMSINTTLSENGRNVIVKIVNPTENPYDLTIEGDWKQLTSAGYEFIAPGSLKASNSMESPDAVSVKKMEITPVNNTIIMTIEPLSAGVLKLTKGF